MLARFCLYGFLKNQRYFEPFLMLAFLEQGLTYFWIGMLIGIRSLTINLLEIPSGAIADTWGRRSSMIVSFVAYITSFLTFALANHVWWFAVAMVLYGVGDSFRTGTHKAMIFEWLRLEGRIDEKTRVYGTTRSWSKYGSALSAILAALFVVVSGNYRSIFLFATLPYVLNIINFAGYPAALDGRTDQPRTVRQTWHNLRRSVGASMKKRSLRGLMVESMSWEGVFHAVKDYIQPVLAGAVVGLAVSQHEPQASDPRSAIAIGATYTVLFLLSGFASRWAHLFAKWSGGEEEATTRLWLINAIGYGVLGIFAWSGALWIVVAMFVLLNILQNIWRPILISRFDEHTNAGNGATVLSIESGAQRISTLVIAPLVGLWVDNLAGSSPDARFWPIGVIGFIAAVAILAAKLIFQSETDRDETTGSD